MICTVKVTRQYPWELELLYIEKMEQNGCLVMYVPVLYNTHIMPSFLMYRSSIFDGYSLATFKVIGFSISKLWGSTWLHVIKMLWSRIKKSSNFVKAV